MKEKPPKLQKCYTCDDMVETRDYSFCKKCRDTRWQKKSSVKLELRDNLGDGGTIPRWMFPKDSIEPGKVLRTDGQGYLSWGSTKAILSEFRIKVCSDKSISEQVRQDYLGRIDEALESLSDKE